MAKILILANNDVGLYKFRLELIQEILRKHEVFISLPYGEFIPKLINLGCNFIETPISRRGTNPITDMRLLKKYKSIMKEVKPDIVLTYTIKPNVYGGLASKMARVPYITNITGLGTAVESVGLLQKLTLFFYKISLNKANCVFFQNEMNRKFFEDKKLVRNNTRLIPGSGVNLEQYTLEDYPENDEKIKFLFIGRIMKAKGIEELLEAAKIVKASYPNVQFDLIGASEEDDNQRLEELHKLNIINYYGQQDDVHSFIKGSHATILPSYHEGTANVLLESAASGRPVLATRVPGCKETFDECVSGLGFEVRNVDSLVKSIIQFIKLPYEKKMTMGIAGRAKMENEFDRSIIVNAYVDEMDRIIIKEK